MLEEHDHQHAVHEFDGIIENRVTSPPAYFTVLFYGLVIWGVAFCAFYLLSDWSSEKEFNAEMAAYQQEHAAPTPSGPEEQQPAAAAVAGAGPAGGQEIDAAGLYAKHCAMCHGEDGGGGIGPQLNAPGYIYGRSEDQIMASISTGRPNGMPAFENKLSEAEIGALVDHLRVMSAPAEGSDDQQPSAPQPTEKADQAKPAKADTEQAPAEATGTAAQVDAAALYAQKCSACHGADGKGGIGPNLTDAKYIYGKTQADVVESIKNGRPKGMPAFGNQLKDQEIDALATYVREL